MCQNLPQLGGTWPSSCAVSLRPSELLSLTQKTLPTSSRAHTLPRLTEGPNHASCTSSKTQILLHCSSPCTPQKYAYRGLSSVFWHCTVCISRWHDHRSCLCGLPSLRGQMLPGSGCIGPRRSGNPCRNVVRNLYQFSHEWSTHSPWDTLSLLWGRQQHALSTQYKSLMYCHLLFQDCSYSYYI